MSKNFANLFKQASLLFQQNNFTEAKALLQSTIQPSQDCYEGYLLLSTCFFKLGEYSQAIEVGRKAERFDPLQKEFQSIQLNMQQRNINAAEKTALLMLEKITGHPRAIFTLVHIYQQRGLIEKSIHYLKIGVNRSPANVLLRKMFITNLEAYGRYEEMLSEAKILVQVANTAENMLNLIGLLLKYARYEEVIEYCNIAKGQFKEQTPVLSNIELLRSHALRVLGRSEGCISSLHTSLKLTLENPRSWAALADLKTYTFTESEVSSLEKLIESPKTAEKDKSVMLFALAKSYEQNNPLKTFQTYERANALFSKHIDYRTSNTERDVSVRIQAFNPNSLRTQASIDRKSDRPIFIVGLPRSGSTLLEQMLASHSCIENTLEQPTINALERQANELCVSRFNRGLFSSVGELTAEELAWLNQKYYDIVSVFSPNNTHFFIDKLPFNFRQIGLIHKILPNALIIDIRRNPMDCGLSLFKQYFSSGVDFSYRQKHIGHFYNQYVKLMRHWDEALPNKIIRIQYEELVTEPEIQLERIFNAMNLKSELACLNFHKNQHIVHTASSEQVRRPLTTSSIGGWLKFKEQLTELAHSLDPSIHDEQSNYFQLG